MVDFYDSHKSVLLFGLRLVDGSGSAAPQFTTTWYLHDLTTYHQCYGIACDDIDSRICDQEVPTLSSTANEEEDK